MSISVNSLSGGKTSSYMAVHHPADVNIFAMVCIGDHNAAGKLRHRKDLLKYANDKLERFQPTYGDFKATAEDPLIIQTMMELEQKIGKEIVWVRGVDFEELIKTKKYLPNKAARFCTSELKIKPVFEHCFFNLGSDIDMRIGYRFDESERKDSINDTYKFAHNCNYYKTGRQNFKTVVWRKSSFPMIDDVPAIHPQIHNFWMNDTSVSFTNDSNCQMCFWKDPQQKLANFETNRPVMLWGAVQEAIIEKQFDVRMSLLDNMKIGKQLDFILGTGSGCTGGMCTS